jgi:hypothetical protein
MVPANLDMREALTPPTECRLAPCHAVVGKLVLCGDGHHSKRQLFGLPGLEREVSDRTITLEPPARMVLNLRAKR